MSGGTQAGVNATSILDAIARKHARCALVREVLVGDEEADRWAETDQWVAGGRIGPMPELTPEVRRIDGLMFDGGGTRTAIEVKISRADFLRETDAKRRPWRKITHRFVYATPVGLLRPTEIPTGCGLWEVAEDGKVAIVVRARLNRDPAPIPHHVTVALAYRAMKAA